VIESNTNCQLSKAEELLEKIAGFGDSRKGILYPSWIVSMMKSDASIAFQN
jgi:hypothetical protein